MLRKCSLFFLLLIHVCIIHAQSGWKIAGDRLTTEWTSRVDPSNVLAEYPRPQMKRTDNWINLNGLWQYNILPKTEGEELPASYAGNILVPYAVESALSGVSKTVGKDSML